MNPYLSQLEELEIDTEKLRDGTALRDDIIAQIRCVLNIDKAYPDDKETPENIKYIRKKINFVLNTNFNGSNGELVQALADEPPDTEPRP